MTLSIKITKKERMILLSISYHVMTALKSSIKMLKRKNATQLDVKKNSNFRLINTKNYVLHNQQNASNVAKSLMKLAKTV